MVDLIPLEYRRTLRLRRWLRAFGWACAGVAALTGFGRLGLAHLVRAEQAELAAARRIQAASGAYQAQLADLRARRDDARRQLKALDVLRGPAVIREMFFAVDTALTGKVWFNELSFAREGELAQAKLEAREIGYFILVPREKPAAAARGDSPAGAAASAAEQAWRTRQRVDIRGQALDHSTLAQFINRLDSQPGIAQVRLVDTSARRYSSLQVVDFQLAVLLGSHAGAAR